MNIVNTLYIAGTTLWLMTLAEIADFHPLEDMTGLAGQVITF